MQVPVSSYDCEDRLVAGQEASYAGNDNSRGDNVNVDHGNMVL